MFSSRARFDLTPNRLSTRLEQKRRAGARLLDLTESNPTRAGITAPADVLSALGDPRGLAYDPQPAGMAAARAAVAADFRRRGFEVDAARIVLTASTSEAYAWLFKLLCDAGDRVLVPRPSYPLFEYLAGLESVGVDHYPLAWDGEWHLSVADLEAALAPTTRAVVVVSPNNPTGSYLKRSEAEALFALCAERRLAVIGDEVFADYAFASDPRRLTSLAGDPPALAFSLGGLSKSCGLPQLKLGWIGVFGPDALRNEACDRLEIIADTYLSVATPIQIAAASILGRLPELQAPIADRIRTNLAALRARLAGTPASLLEPEGGWSAVLRVPSTLCEEDRILRLLEERDVLVHPGFFFDFEREAYLVVSLLPRREVFAEALQRLVADLVL